MIVISYEEERVDSVTGVTTYIPLGSESHQNIEEVLLPNNPRPNSPIFFTKKFVGQPEYRWQVSGVLQKYGAAPLTYVVTLIRRPQIDKEFYLKKILAVRNEAVRRVLHPWSIVEVEFGHSLTVGKASGDIKGNKRYVDTVQLYSMPKRRLAVVIQVIERSVEDLVQVIPITSKQPPSTEKAVVEVTSELSKMVHYQKPSWAICRMIQTVTASRVIAPLIQRTPGNHLRDKGFRNSVRGQVREALKDALMFGVAADSRVRDTADLATEKTLTAQLTSQLATLEPKVKDLESKVALYEKFVQYSGFTQDDILEMFQEAATE